MSEITSLEPPVSLEAPEAVPVLTPEKAVELVPLAKKEVATVDPRVSSFVKDLMSVNPQSPEFSAKLQNINSLGTKEISSTSNISSRMLDRPAQQKASSSPQMKVAKDLGDLRRQITELDPARADLKGVKKILKFIPGGNKIDAYFDRYASAKSQLDAINTALANGQDELRKDNADIETYRTAMWTDMGKLGEYNNLLKEIDAAISDKLVEAKNANNVELARALESDALFAVRQKQMDIQTQMAVAVQGYLSLDLVRKNNTELIRGVDRAQTTTMAAMRTAVVVAQALNVQERVLTQINALNSTTSAMIESTSIRLKEQGTAIQQQASSSMIEVDKLQAAFDNVFQAMDDIDSFRIKANDNFAVTIQSLETQIGKAKPYLERANHNGPVPASVTSATNPD